MRKSAPLALTALLLLLPALSARAEYRAYELEVVDTYDCVVNKRDSCRRAVVRTGISPDSYQRTHGGEQRVGVMLLATWMCYGDTSNYQPVCPRPAPRKGKFAAGDQVRVKLNKHITNGWAGAVEVAYYQASVNSNVYGVRFSNRQNVYARYYEKDLEKGAGSPAQAGQTPPPAGPAAAGQPAPAAAQAPNAPPAAAPQPTVTPAPATTAAPAPAPAPTAGAAPAAQAAPTQNEPPQ